MVVTPPPAPPLAVAAFRPVVSHKSNFGGVKCCSILLEDRHDDAIDVAVVLLEELELAAVNVGETQGDDDMEVLLQWLLLLLLLVDDKDVDDDIDEDMDNVVELLFLFEAQEGRGKSTNSS